MKLTAVGHLSVAPGLLGERAPAAWMGFDPALLYAAELDDLLTPRSRNN